MFVLKSRYEALREEVRYLTRVLANSERAYERGESQRRALRSELERLRASQQQRGPGGKFLPKPAPAQPVDLTGGAGQ